MRYIGCRIVSIGYKFQMVVNYMADYKPLMLFKRPT